MDEIELVYPVSGIHYADISMRSFIYVKPSEKRTPQPYRVYKISAPISGKVTINARHRRYDLGKNTGMPVSETASAAACNNVLQKIKASAVEDCPFTFWTNVTTAASYDQKVPRSILQSLGGIEGSVLDQYGGEYEFNNLTVKLWKNRGSEIDYHLAYGKNITDIKQEKNISETITGVVPYWSNMEGTEVVTLPEKAVYSPNAGLYSQRLTVPLDMSADYQEKPTVETLRNAARTYVNQSGVGIPKVSIEVSFIALWNTEEYKDIAPLQRAGLCDIVPIDFEPLGITGVKSKIVKVVYDCLKERYKSMTLGSIRSNLATTITDQTAGIHAEIARQYAQTGNAISDAVQNATAWLTSSGGYVVAVKNTDGTWKELLFLDSDDIAEARNVLRINENGIGFSSSGVDGPYTQAWTLDGRLVIGGTNVPSLTVYDANDNIIFEATADYVTWNAENSSMDEDGRITMNDAQINGGTITQEDKDNQTWLQISDAEIRGGRGAFGQNGTSVDFGFIINGRSNGNLTLSANYLGLNVNDIGVTESKGDTTFWNGYSGEYVSYINYDTQIDYIEDLDISWERIESVVVDLDIDFDSGTASWGTVTFSIPNNFNFRNGSVDVPSEHGIRNMVHGIGT